jgi:hypothetical protein
MGQEMSSLSICPINNLQCLAEEYRLQQTAQEAHLLQNGSANAYVSVICI